MKRLVLSAIAFALVLAVAPRAEAQTSPVRLGLTGGASLKTNIALVKNNAKLAAEIAAALAA